MAVVWHILILIVGSAMILVGANYFTGAAGTVARRLGVSDFVIGLTLVAVGSSAPDLAVGVFSAAEGHTQFALGNVVGSCTFDGLLVIGVVALMHPIVIGRQMLTRQIPYLLIAYLVVVVCANSYPMVITRGDGVLMLVVFGLILWQELTACRPDESQESRVKSQETKKPSSNVSSTSLSIKGKIVLWIEILGGLGALVWGGNLFVSGASGIAAEAHISETVIGLTVVALGTSLPDLATSAVAAWKHKPGIAVGNVVGSCMMDALMVLGCSAMVRPLPLGGVNNFDLLTMAGSGVLLWVIPLLYKSRKIGRFWGAIFVALYAAYMTLTVIGK